MFRLRWPWIVIIASFMALIIWQSDTWLSSRSVKWGGDPNEDLSPSMTPSEVVDLIMPIVVTLAVLGCALYVIISKAYPEANQKWAFGAIGTILGFWLKTL